MKKKREDPVNHRHAARCRGDDASRSVQSRRVTPGGALWRRPVSLGAAVRLCPSTAQNTYHFQQSRTSSVGSAWWPELFGYIYKVLGGFKFPRKKNKERKVPCAPAQW